MVKKYFTTAADGKNYQTRFYNLDAIISVGYRVKSGTATQFRIRATDRLREYIVKGFVLDDERLKNPDLPFAQGRGTGRAEQSGGAIPGHGDGPGDVRMAEAVLKLLH